MPHATALWSRGCWADPCLGVNFRETRMVSAFFSRGLVAHLCCHTQAEIKVKLGHTQWSSHCERAWLICERRNLYVLKSERYLLTHDNCMLPHTALDNLTPKYVDGTMTRPQSAGVLTKYVERSWREAAVTHVLTKFHARNENGLPPSQEPNALLCQMNPVHMSTLCSLYYDSAHVISPDWVTSLLVFFPAKPL